MDTHKQHILATYDISDEFATEWSGAGESVDTNYTAGEELSKYALLRELTRRNSAAGGLPPDEPDPLGSTPSIVSVLRSRNIDVDSDASLKAQYFISSREFNPRAFLRDVHKDASFANLHASLEYLESSIAKRSEALRGLVEHDYDRFVKSKSAMDMVFDQFEKSGFTSSGDGRLSHLIHFTDDANSKTTMIMKPVIDHQAKEERLKSALKVIDNNRYLFNLPSVISEDILANDHEGLVRDYRRGKDIQYSKEIAPNSSETAVENKKVTDRIWQEVEEVVENHKKSLWNSLTKSTSSQNYIQLISRLLDLGVEDNPIIEWINARLAYFHRQATELFEKLRLRSNIMSMNLASVPSNPESSFCNPLKQMKISPRDSDVFLCDSMEIIEMWLIIKGVLDDLSDLMQEICEFWNTCRGFLDGQKQANLPTGYQGESRVHLSLSSSEITEVKKNARDLKNIFVKQLADYFTSPASAGKSPLSLQHHRISMSSTDTYIFMPPHANALGASRYLLDAVRSLSNSLQALFRSGISSESPDKLKNLLDILKERSIHAICIAWEDDSKKYALVENWNSSEGITMFPEYLSSYNGYVVERLKELVNFIPENSDYSPSTTKLVKLIYTSYTQSMNIALEQVSSHVMNEGNSGTKVENESAANLQLTKELLPKDISQETKCLLTLSNFGYIRQKVVPENLQLVENLFKTSTNDIKIMVGQNMDKLEGPLFDAYTRKNRSLLSEIVRYGVLKSGADWKSMPKPKGISSYVHDALIQLVITHAKVTDISPSLTNRVIGILYGHLIQMVLTVLREVEQFSTGGCLQALADVEFLRAVLAKYKTGDSTQCVQNIYTALKDSSTDKKLWAPNTDPRQYVKDTVDISLQHSRLDYACFKRE